MRGSKPGERRGGRGKGTPNKDTLDLYAKCEALKIDPFDELLKMAADKGLKEELRLKALTEVSQYLYSKRKAIELSNKEDQGFTIIIKDYDAK